MCAVMIRQPRPQTWLERKRGPNCARQKQVFMRKKNSTHCPSRLPRRRLDVTTARTRAATLLAGIRAGGITSIAFPSVCSKHSVAVIEAEHKCASTYRCGGSAGWTCCEQRVLLLPVELRHVNHAASTNPMILHGMPWRRFNIGCSGFEEAPGISKVDRGQVERFHRQCGDALCACGKSTCILRCRRQ